MNNLFIGFTALTLCILLGVTKSSFSQTDDRDQLYRLPSDLLQSEESNNKNSSSKFYQEFDYLVKWNALDLLYGHTTFGFEKSISDQLSLEVIGGFSISNRSFGIGTGFIGEIIRDLRDFSPSDADVSPDLIGEFGTPINSRSPIVGIGIKGFTESNLFDQAYRIYGFEYRFSRNTFDMTNAIITRRLPLFTNDVRINEADLTARVNSHLLGIKYGLQFISFKNLKLSNELTWFVGINMIYGEQYDIQTYQQGSLFFEEITKSAEKGTRIIPTVQIRYSLGLGR